jgi:hypothetical protein
MKFVGLFYFILISAQVYSQYNDGVLIGSNLDLIKSDHDGYFEKVQVALEANYFLSEKFSATGGIEVWSRDGASAVMGTRWYPVQDAFVRLRGMIGKNNDISIGGGWAKPMTETLRFESMADFYFEGTFSIRAGFAVILR